MKRIIVCLQFLHASLILAPSAWASWGSFVSTGTSTGIGNPSCAQASTGLAACAVRNSASAIMVNRFNGTSWGTWSKLAGTVSSDPSCTSDGAGKVICAATAGAGQLAGYSRRRRERSRWLKMAGHSADADKSERMTGKPEVNFPISDKAKLTCSG
jgi:hypothetical protein